ncbi:long-chain-fatty-acid--CoA ligase [Pseudomonas farris]
MQAFLTQPLHKAVRQCPQAPALSFGELTFSYAALTERVARLASALQTLGMQAGDRVGMLSLNSHRYIEYFYGVWWGGGAINPVNIRWNPKEVAYSLDDCDTRVLLVDDTFKAMIPTLRELSKSLRTIVYTGDGDMPEGAVGYETLLAQAMPVADACRQGDDLAAVLYTGGTTGQPKGVMLSHTNLVTSALGSLLAIPRPPDATAVIAMPIFHVGGFGHVLQLIMGLHRIVILPAFEEIAVLRAIQQHRATEMGLVPIMIKRMLEHPRFTEYDVSSVRLMIYGAAPIDATLLATALQALPRVNFYQSYGMTECSPIISVLPAYAHLEPHVSAGKLRSAGVPTMQADVRIVDAEDRDVPQDSVGEIITRGPMVMLGYWNKPQETAAALRGGWMHTGDSGYLDADGFLYTVDRLKDMIISGGENVYSAEVENAIAQMPEVSMSAVIGIPDDMFGERVHAVVVLRPGAVLTEQAVTEHCRTLIAGYKCPRSVEFRDQLPVTAAGKLQKFVLREPFWQGRERKVN